MNEALAGGRRYRITHHTTYDYDDEVTDSYGLVSIALDRRSAAEELRIHAGDGVTIRPAE